MCFDASIERACPPRLAAPFFPHRAGAGPVDRCADGGSELLLPLACLFCSFCLLPTHPTLTVRAPHTNLNPSIQGSRASVNSIAGVGNLIGYTGEVHGLGPLGSLEWDVRYVRVDMATRDPGLNEGYGVLTTTNQSIDLSIQLIRLEDGGRSRPTSESSDSEAAAAIQSEGHGSDGRHHRSSCLVGPPRAAATMPMPGLCGGALDLPSCSAATAAANDNTGSVSMAASSDGGGRGAGGA